jgi:hypothetical protein
MVSRELFKKRNKSRSKPYTRTLVVVFKGKDAILPEIPSSTLDVVATLTNNIVLYGINPIATSFS